MNIKTFLMTCVLAVCLLAQSAMAGQFDDGKTAYERRNYAKALQLFRPMAEQGDAKAQHFLGVMYVNGKGVPQDFAEAVKWYRKAADQGYAGAQNNLGLMYLKGNGVPQDYVQAHRWFNLAAASLSVSETGMRAGAVHQRDAVAKRMTPDQIAEAQRLAREWLAAHPKK
jgi:TPR repeat protein